MEIDSEKITKKVRTFGQEVWRKITLGLVFILIAAIVGFFAVLVMPGILDTPKVEIPKATIEIFTAQDTTGVAHGQYEIITFEKHKYMLRGGGMVHLESCKCKKAK